MLEKEKSKKLHQLPAGKKQFSAKMYLYCVSLLVACELMLSFSFFGYINIPPVSVTTLHIVVLVAAFFLGRTAGAAVGAVFGLSSIWKASVLPFVTANAAFSPFISPNPWGSIVTGLLTRIAFGYLAGLIFDVLKKHLPEWPALFSGTFLATILHSFLVYTSMWYFFPKFGITPFNTFRSLIKINAVITYGLAFLVLGCLNVLMNHTKMGRNFMELLYSGDKHPLDARELQWIGIFSSLFFVIAISLVMYFIDDITRIFTYYKVTLTPENQSLVVNMGMQFACGTLAAYFILILIFVHVYGVLGEAREKAKESKLKFFTNVSHDMRTPLNGIIGCTDLALEAEDSAEKDKYLSNIRVSGRVMLDLVNDILDISKMENDMFQLNPKVCSMKLLIDNITIPIEAAAKNKKVRFTADTEHAMTGYVLIDHVNVQKIILNLLSNAVKFTPAGGEVSFKMEQLPVPVDGNNCRVTVKDSGIGISPEFLLHIYEPFVQEKNDISEKQGTGLGLSIVDMLVKLMHGKISVQSAQGTGTEFTVLLPFPGAAKPQDLLTGKDAETADTHLLAGRKILLCEDNDINAMIAETILEKSGAKVIRAVNGADAVDAYRKSAEGEFSVILMDLRMPVIDGYTAAKQIRRMQRTDAGTIRIIALSAMTMEEDIAKCTEAGMNDFIGKPFEKNELLRKTAGRI